VTVVAALGVLIWWLFLLGDDQSDSTFPEVGGSSSTTSTSPDSPQSSDPGDTAPDSTTATDSPPSGELGGVYAMGSDGSDLTWITNGTAPNSSPNGDQITLEGIK